MSTTTTHDRQYAATLLADALVREAASSRGHRRLVLRNHLGVTPGDIFDALVPRLDPAATVPVHEARVPVTLLGVALEDHGTAGTDRLLVPYLVGEPGQNSGTAGFAALLRDHVPAGPGQRVLLILDASPVETVRTAAEDAATLPLLQWRACARAAVEGARGQVAELCQAILTDDGRFRRLERKAATLSTLHELAGHDDPRDAGRALHELGCYLSDPAAYNDHKRLLRSAQTRAKLQSWLAPGQDFDQRLAALYANPDSPQLDRVRNARTPFGLDYAAFTLDDIPTRTAPARPLRLASPVSPTEPARMTLGNRAVIWKPGGGAFGIALATPASADALATITWSDTGEPEELPVAAGDRYVEILATGTGWRFARLAVEGGQAAELAVFLDEGRWAPFEAGLDLDLDELAFRTGAEPRLLALGPGGELAGQPTIGLLDRPEPGQREVLEATLAGERHPIPLLIEDEEDLDEPAPGPNPDPRPEPPDGDGDGDDGGDDDDEDKEGEAGGRPEAVPAVASVAHALLLATGRGDEVGGSQFLVTTDGEGRRSAVIATPGRYDLEPQDLGGELEGLELERQILDSPDTTAFTVLRGANGATLHPHPYLEQLDISGIEGVDAFRDARAELFAAVRGAGSMHAIAAGIGAAEAQAYVDAYEAVLDSLLLGDRFLAEYEKLFLCDAVADAQSGELLIAPSNPLSVAYLLALGQQFAGWHPRAGQVLPEDLKACTMRHLVPYFSVQGDWYETGAPAPLLWRRYRPASVGHSSDHRPAYITRRIERFLEVHPEYGDARQLLGLAFYEPGDGAAVLEALRSLARRQIRGTARYSMPRLAVTIVSASEAATLVEELVTGQLSDESDADTDRLLRDRLEVSRATPDQGDPAFAHLSFVFESPLERQPAAINLAARATTLFVDGLAAVPGRHIEPGRNETTFLWGTFTGAAGQGPLPSLVRKSLELVSGMPRDPITPGRTRMPSTRVAPSHLRTLYNASAWVVHLDRLLGLEAFAPDASGRHARYVVDYSDRVDTAQPGLDAITATNRIEPYHRALRQALSGIGRPNEDGLRRLLQLFNGVSGQWALDLIRSNPEPLRERIALATAVQALDGLDGLHGEGSIGVVVPVDEVLDALPRAARPSKGSLCDDLLYVRIPTEVGKGHVDLRGRLLEVKYRGSTDPKAAPTARQQLERGRDWLLSTFGDRTSPAHPFRARDLSELLRAAATRADAFRLLPQGVSRAALEPALDAISHGKFELRLDYGAGGQTQHGEFISIEADSTVLAHRQPLAGEGLSLGHLRLGRPALEALAAGKEIPRPASLAAVTFDGPAPDGAGGPEGSGGPGPQDPEGSGGPGPVEPRAGGGGSQMPPTDQPGGKPPRQAAEQAPAPSRSPEAPPAEVTLFAGRLDTAFAKYGLSVEPFRPELAQVGPSIVRFRTRTLGRLSITEVERRARDLGREIAASGEVSIGDEPGYVTVDVPRSERVAVPLPAVLGSLDAAPARPGALNFVAGMAPSGAVEVADLSRLPHLLVAGATGSGKSVFLRGLLVELLRARTPEQLSLLIIDPKRLDFAAFARAPHLRGNAIISDPDEALEVLQHTLEAELARRQPILEEAGVSSAAEYYESGGRLEDLPQLVILVDEFADLVLAGTDRRAFSELVQRYAQLTRAYGIFLVLATQRPSVDVVTGSIKANLSARIAFSLPSATDSRTVLDRGGAEDLLGDGDLLFYRNGRVQRLQAPFTSAADVRAVIS